MMVRGGGAAGGGRGRGFYGAGATGARGGPKRKPALSSNETGGMQGGDANKLNASVDTWSSPPIAQQPLNQTMDSYGDGAEWYRDSYAPGQTW